MTLPAFGWFGILAALLFVAAAATAMARRMPAKKRFVLHRYLAGAGLLSMAIHAIWALARYL